MTPGMPCSVSLACDQQICSTPSVLQACKPCVFTPAILSVACLGGGARPRRKGGQIREGLGARQAETGHRAGAETGTAASAPGPSPGPPTGPPAGQLGGHIPADAARAAVAQRAGGTGADSCLRFNCYLHPCDFIHVTWDRGHVTLLPCRPVCLPSLRPQWAPARVLWEPECHALQSAPHALQSAPHSKKPAAASCTSVCLSSFGT